MPKTAIRKRFKHKKDHDKKSKKSKTNHNEQNEPSTSESESDNALLKPTESTAEPAKCCNTSVVVTDHDEAAVGASTSSDHGEMGANASTYSVLSPCSVPSPLTSPLGNEDSNDAFNFKIPFSDSDDSSSCSSSLDTSFSQCVSDGLPDRDLMRDVKLKLELFLHDNCICLVQQDHFDVLFMSRGEDKVTQRQLIFSWDGKFSLKVHCSQYPVDNFVKNVRPSKCLIPNTVGYFVDRMVDVINLVRDFEICTGVANNEYKAVWSSCDRGVIDLNPYKESRYTTTFRSLQCDRLVNRRRRKCVECNKLAGVLHRKYEMASKEEVHPNTPNIRLNTPQKLKKLEDQRKELDNTKRRLERLKIQRMIEKEGVAVDKSLSGDFQKVLESLDLDKQIADNKITPQQALFLEQQLTNLGAKSAKGRRWHPSMIRFALSIYQKSPGAYGAIYESGMLTLPSRRTLFDYTHFKPVQEGIHYEVLESVSKKLEGMKEYQRYHVIMCDEMHISKNLVFEKSTGRVIGFITLDDVQIELDALDTFLKDPNAKPTRPPVASKVLTFMIKGVSNNVKEAIATYAVDTLTKEQLYRWSWDVITKCERAGVAIIAYVCDGSSINRSFIKMNKPYTPNSSVVYDTINKAAPNDTLNKKENEVRLLYFIADTPHLLKTIRNCFYSSSDKRYLHKKTGKMKLRRRLEKNGQKIMWSTIIKLYNHQKNKAVRLAYKLNVQNVFLNSYSKMKVKYAAEVLSETVAQLLESLNWENMEETIRFIRNVNEFFDMLNGAHSHHGAKKRNPNLDSYCTVTDGRFEKLQKFLEYLQEWEADAKATAKNTDESVNASKSQAVDDPDCDADNELDDEEDENDDPASVRQLSHQTLEGIQITVKGFTGAVQFLLREGVKFVNARVFCQDPVEQYFSKQRARGGGSNNPNFSRVLHNQRSIHIQGNLGVKKSYRGNTEVQAQSMSISSEPLPKRRRVSSAATKK